MAKKHSKNMDKATFMQAVLTTAGEIGWSRTALDQAGQNLGLPPGAIEAHFPGGLQDVSRTFQDWVDESMATQLEKTRGFETAKVREKIFRAVMARLDVMKPFRAGVATFTQHQRLAWNRPLAARAALRAADRMWKAAGDRSTDYNYYTKRMLLSGVYARTLLFWLKDESENGTATQDFLRRRIEEVLAFGKTVQDIKARFARRESRG